MSILPLRDAAPEAAFGGKAASLAKALRAGLPVPDGFAISWDGLEDREAIAAAYRALGAERVAVRSSAIGEDSAEASFAGQHATVLNVTSLDALFEAIGTIRDSARSEAAMAYRQKVGVAGEPRIGVVVQKMVESDIAGVLFTRDPVTGANERVVESAWGLGEAVVAGLVTPDRFRMDAAGKVLAREVGAKPMAIRYAPEGGTREVRIPDLDARRLSLTDGQLAELHELGRRCEKFFGAPQDLEWAIAGGSLFLLQSRPVTTAVSSTTPALPLRSFAGLALAAVLAPLNSTIVAVALPSIATTFGASESLVTRWLVTAYLVVAIVAQSPAGRAADIWGYSRVLTLGRALFGLGAILAAFSPQLAVLGAGRVLMALGGALAIPTVFAVIRNSVPESSRGRVFGIFGAIMGTAAAIGPLVGGFLTSSFGWHSIFVVNVPVVALSLLLEPPRREAKRERRAPLGAMGFLRLFSRPSFAAGSAIVALQNLAMYAMLFLLPFFLARTGSTPSATGRMLLFFTVAMVLASPVGGRLSDALGSRVVAMSGATIGTVGASLFVTGGALAPALVLLGAGIGISTSPSQAAALSAVDASQAGAASGALSTMRYLGGVLGSGLVALLAASPHDARLWVFPAVLFASALAALSLVPQTARR
ncbi:MAG TPA: MFS transporter [Thermoanaerobaculia bacterium]